jgi:hypothetical protein
MHGGWFLVTVLLRTHLVSCDTCGSATVCVRVGQWAGGCGGEIGQGSPSLLLSRLCVVLESDVLCG